MAIIGVVMNVEIPKHIEALLDRADCAGPASEELILGAEQSLGVAFPSQYRAFLRRYGAARWFRRGELFGLTYEQNSVRGKPPMWVDLRWVARYSLPEGMPRKLVPIASDGGDYKFYLTTEARGKVAAGSVVVYGPGLDGVEVAPDFFEFVEKAASKGTWALVPDCS